MNDSTTHVEIETAFIPLADGRRLAARIWLPERAAAQPPEAVPAVLEYIPYRRRDGTAPRDDSTYPHFAAAGIAGVRVDTSGNGDSDGDFDDEYSSRELDDGVQVIAWIAAQPWCSGSVGMMGISWGGFNSLQIAALQPPALKAVIAIGTTVDRYNDDIHYKNGCQLYSNLSWSSNMLCYAGRAPDPLVVGESWREMWLHRLKTQPFPVLEWLRHQRRDDYWRHGSICEDFSAIRIPALVISGWCDGYVNAPPETAANLDSCVKAINGPWIHKYPHFAWPRPRMDFHAEAINWWNRWLRGEQNGVENLPAYRAYMSEELRPGASRRHEAGRWVAEEHWPSGNISPLTLFPHGDQLLPEAPGAIEHRSVCTTQDFGTQCGEYFTLKPGGELPGDHAADDARCVCFDLPVSESAVDILGRPTVRVKLAIDRPQGNIIVRLMDVHPDGVSQRVSWGVLNLCHRFGYDKPQAMQPGVFEQVEINLDHCAYRFRPGHSIRLAISTTYWPMVLPGPDVVTATMELGEYFSLSLPVRGPTDDYPVPEPENQNLLPEYREHRPSESRRFVEQDLEHRLTRYHIVEDTGEHEVPGHGLIAGDRRQDCYSIDSGDPLSLELKCSYSHHMRRGDWSVRLETRSNLSCDDKNFFLEAEVVAWVGDEEFNRRQWRETIARDFM